MFSVADRERIRDGAQGVQGSGLILDIEIRFLYRFKLMSTAQHILDLRRDGIHFFRCTYGDQNIINSLFPIEVRG